jgi:hypothetical protein
MTDFEVIYLLYVPLLQSTLFVKNSFTAAKATTCDRAACMRIAPPSSYQAGNFRLTPSSIAKIISSRMPLPQA